MKNFDHLLELVQLKWAVLGIIFVLCVICCLVFRSKLDLWLKIVIFIASMSCVVWFSAGIRTEFNLTLLSGEDDATAEEGFKYLENHISNSQLMHLLSQGEQEHPYLASNNVRFYLALLAAERNLPVLNAKDIVMPSFFGTNDYTGFAHQLEYPITYEGFLRKYRETLEGSQVKNN
jgi:hypothetical protein